MKIKTLLMGAVAATSMATFAQAERGSDGHVSLLYWQAPSILNPYLSGGTKDLHAASMILEPLARFDETGALVPFLAQDIPTVENGGVSADLTSITWKLKPGLKWTDGSPVTSADVAFTADYCMHPEGGCAQGSKFDAVASIETPDDLTVKVNFKSAVPYPYTAFVGMQSPIIQKAQFEACIGPKAPECTDANFGPQGTGPFTVTDFRPNDVIQYKANENYRDPAKPAFATLTMKGGGDATGAGRAVLETGEYDYGWNLQLAPDVLAKMSEGGKGTIVTAFGSWVERLEVNLTDPSPALDADTRSTVAAPHPSLSDPAVRAALSMAVDRVLLTEIGYGSAGTPICDLIPAPAAIAPGNTHCLTQDIAGANKMLDDAGWARGSDGVRAKDGVRLSYLFQTSTNAVRQDYQALIKEWWAEIGVETELRNISASVFFGGDPGSPDTFQKFYADIEMYTNGFEGTDPQSYVAAYRCGNEPKPSSQWQGENINRFCNAEYDKAIDELAKTADLGKRAELVKKMNNMLTKDSNVIIPLTYRGNVSAHANSLLGVKINAFDSQLWNIADWTRAD